MENNLNTQNPNNYIFDTKHLKIQILGGIKFNNLEAMRVTLGTRRTRYVILRATRRTRNVILRATR
jgi:hypothetical protein